jgi:hypothetical protein
MFRFANEIWKWVSRISQFFMSLSFRYSAHHTVFPLVFQEQSHIQRNEMLEWLLSIHVNPK